MRNNAMKITNWTERCADYGRRTQKERATYEASIAPFAYLLQEGTEGIRKWRKATRKFWKAFKEATVLARRDLTGRK